VDFVALVDQVIALLRQRGRVTYRTLQRQFQLDADALADLLGELRYAHRDAMREDEQGIEWTDDARPAPPATAAPPEQAARAPLTYTPAYLAEKILTSRSALEGERKQVTVLFADLKGSMELLADRDPEEARQLLDPVLEQMMEAVHRYEGTVNQVMGDGIMVLFGAPIAHEDHAVRACYAALAMQAAVQRYAEEVRRTQGLTVQMRVGLNSGEVVVRAIGNDLHMDYSAVGQTTHLAARMEQLATPGSSLLTAATLRLVEGLVRVQALGPVPVKGLADPVEVSSWSALRPCGGAYRPPSPGGCRPLWGGSPSWRRFSTPWHGPGLARVRSSPSWVSPAWANRAWSTSSSIHTTHRAGLCWRVAPCPTVRPRRTYQCVTCSKPTVTSRSAMTCGRCGPRSPGSS
jgi:class 3 adenylate cyclase